MKQEFEESRYPSASEMPELNTAQPGTPEAGKEAQDMKAFTDPIISSLGQLQTLILALKQKGAPNAQALEEHFKGLLEALGAKGPEAAPQEQSQEGEEMPEETNEVAAQPFNKKSTMGGAKTGAVPLI